MAVPTTIGTATPIAARAAAAGASPAASNAKARESAGDRGMSDILVAARGQPLFRIGSGRMPRFRLMAVLAQALQRVLLAAAVIAGVAVAAPQTAGAASSPAAAVSAEAAPSVTTAPGLPGHHGPREVMHRAMRLPASLHAAVTPTGALLLAAPVFLLV